VGAAHITCLLHRGQLQEAGIILLQAKDQGTCLYKPADFGFMDTLIMLSRCPPGARELLGDTMKDLLAQVRDLLLHTSRAQEALQAAGGSKLGNPLCMPLDGLLSGCCQQ
jgi:hypothetical protein